MILNDAHIRAEAERGMITPFAPSLIRELDGAKAISYGTGSYGYDIRLSPKEFRVFKATGKTINPKAFDPSHTEVITLESDDYGAFFTIPAYRYALGVAMERLTMPPDVTASCVNKSTYARVGLITNFTPVEAGWQGHLTLEFFNAAPDAMRIYAGEGVAQLVFHRGEPCNAPYGDRKYQGQPENIVFGKV